MRLKITLFSIVVFVTAHCNAQDWKTYPYNPAGSQISFSVDEGRHTGEPIEWWYTAGHLTGDTSGKSYSYMLSYFYYPASVFDGFRILTITDDATETFYQDTQALNYTTLSSTKLDIEASMFFGGTETWTNKLDNASAIIPFEYSLTAFASFGSLSLDYETVKRPLILGDDGYFDQGNSSYTYYYSQTKNEVIGSFTLNGVTENVTGTAWIDRQYGNFNPLNGEQYEWFSLQLSNGMDINLWNIFTPERTIPSNGRYQILSSYVNESTQYTSNDFQIERLAYHWMPDDLKCYAKQWRLTSTTNNLDLIITTLHDNTEVQLPFRFFEGSTLITGTVNGVAVDGIGFAELLHSYEHPEITVVSPNGGIYDTAQPITWQLDNPDEGRPIYYDLEYSNDNQQTFLPIIQGLTEASYLWDGSGLNENDEVWFKIIAYSVDGVLNNTVISSSSSTTTLSINQSNDLGIELYPNPASNRLFLKLPESTLTASLRIIDINGKVIMDKHAEDISNSIDVEYLTSGIYFLSIENERGTSILKFIKR